MNSRFHAVVGLAKVTLLGIGVAWGIFAWRGLTFLAEAFPSPAPPEITPTRLIADVQGYALVCGPAALALILCLIRWPARRGGARNW